MRSLIIIILLFFSGGLYSQDPQLTQFFSSPIYLAPSFTGGTNGSRVVLNYRNQWPLISHGYVTYAASFDHFFANQNSGMGLTYFDDIAGTSRLRTTSYGMSYSYKMQVSRFLVLRPGVRFSQNVHGFDLSKLLFGDQLSFHGNMPVSIENLDFNKVKYLDFGLSFLAYSRYSWWGIVIDHLSKPNQSLKQLDSRIPRKFTLFAGYKHIIESRSGSFDTEDLTFNVLYKHQGRFDQLDLNIFWYKRPLVMGISYRGLPVIKQYDKGYPNHDALALIIGWQFPEIKVGYSYDFSISKLSGKSGGSHEISIIFEFNQEQKVKKRKSDIVQCPKY